MNTQVQQEIIGEGWWSLANEWEDEVIEAENPIAGESDMENIQSGWSH